MHGGGCVRFFHHSVVDETLAHALRAAAYLLPALHLFLAVPLAADSLAKNLGYTAAEQYAAAFISSAARHRHAEQLCIRRSSPEPGADLLAVFGGAVADDRSVGPDSRREGDRQTLVGGHRRPGRRVGHSAPLGKWQLLA